MPYVATRAMLRTTYKSIEVNVHLSPHLLLGILFEAAGETITRIVHHDIDSAELLLRLIECLDDARLVRHIESSLEKILVVGALKFE
jgi:hypothetical protein